MHWSYHSLALIHRYLHVQLPVGMLSAMMSASLMLSRYFTRARKLLPWAAMSTRWPRCVRKKSLVNNKDLDQTRICIKILTSYQTFCRHCRSIFNELWTFYKVSQQQTISLTAHDSHWKGSLQCLKSSFGRLMFNISNNKSTNHWLDINCILFANQMLINHYDDVAYLDGWYDGIIPVG